MKKINLQKNKNQQSGFTILETLVAIFILLLAVTGPMVFAQNGMRTAMLARDQITAFYLAQDAIEFIKNVKDQNGVTRLRTGSNQDWLYGLGDCVDNNKCAVDTTKNEGIQSCDNFGSGGCLDSSPDGSQDNHLKIKTTGDTKLFGYSSSGENSIFSREVQILKIGEDETEIKVKVRWISHPALGAREVNVSEYMYDWVKAVSE